MLHLLPRNYPRRFDAKKLVHNQPGKTKSRLTNQRHRQAQLYHEIINYESKRELSVNNNEADMLTWSLPALAWLVAVGRKQIPLV